MALRDTRIVTQLRLGLGVIVVLVLVLIALAAWQTSVLFEQTTGMYEHPLQVTRAIGRLQSDAALMHRDMKSLLLAEDASEIERTVTELELLEQDVQRQLDELRGRYLGPKADILRLEEDLLAWQTNREESIRLLRTGDREAAVARIAVGVQARRALDSAQVIADFAARRATLFYQEAQARHHALTVQLWVVVGVILVVSLVIAYVLQRNVRRPLELLAGAMSRFDAGDLAARSHYHRRNEFGVLAGSFDNMADGIQAQRALERDSARLADVMLSEDDLSRFCTALLDALVQATRSQAGAAYVLSEDRTVFEHVASLGFGEPARASFSAEYPEGELGAAVSARRIRLITEIPADTRFAYEAVSGGFVPAAIITVPVLIDECVVAVLSLASLRPYEAADLTLVEAVWGMLTARLGGVLSFAQVRDLAERLEHQNRELEAQTRELSAQGDELTEQNTELEQQARELEEANRLKSVFLSTMSHELRTPLNSVIALSGVLTRRLQGAVPGEEYGYLEVIERNGRNLLALINDILDLSRIESGQEQVGLERFLVRPLLDNVVDAVAAGARQKDIALDVDLPDEGLELVGDPGKCRHILINLVGNAVKFTDAGGVRIAVSASGEEIAFAVSDTGIGMTADQLEVIFDEFRQADDGTARRYGGTGLGLAIARKYADLLQGVIEVQSALGKGSTFTLRLPRGLDAHGDGALAGGSRVLGGVAPLEREAPASGRVVLVVEDSEPAVVQLVDILEPAGYIVHVARDGREALVSVESALPDAMILDLMMPEVDGFEVLREIRAREHTRRLPVLILTAKHVTREELSFLEGNNIHQLIQKGDVSREGLLAKVGAMVAGAPERGGGSGHNGPTILVVEDDSDSRRAIRAVLGDEYRVFEAPDGRAGLEEARAHMPDLILMDIAMPVMDGIQALAALREDERLRDTPVIACTASAMSGDREAILAHGFDGYISKPIDAELLQRSLREVLG